MAIAMAPGSTTTPTATKTKEVAFIVDKSGSMETCREQVISGFNEFVGDLKRERDMDIRFSATFFDTEVVVRHDGWTVGDVPILTRDTYRPGGTTALYDAVGATLNALERRLAGNTDTPVVVVIQTDGHENSSREYGHAQIARRISDLQAKGNWTFVFMGANQDAWAAASKLNIPQMNTMSYDSTRTGQSIGSTSQATLKHLRTGLKATKGFYSNDGD